LIWGHNAPALTPSPEHRRMRPGSATRTLSLAERSAGFKARYRGKKRRVGQACKP